MLDSTLVKIEEEWKPLEKKLRKALKKLEGEEEMEEDNNEELIQDEESANRYGKCQNDIKQEPIQNVC